MKNNDVSQTKLCNLTDEAVDRCDGELYKMVQTAGYRQSTRELINDWNAWGMTIAEFKLAVVAAGKADYILGAE